MKNDSTISILKRHTNALISTSLPYLEQIISPFLISYPYWQLAFHEAIGLYGYYMALKQEEVNDYVTFIKNYPEKFTADVVGTKAFRDGFVIAFQDYLKLRTKAKKKIAKEIFLGFTKCSVKEEFDLERLDDVLLRISPHALNVLHFLTNTILPLKEKVLKEELREKNIANSDKSEEWWLNLDWEREPLSRFIQQWIHDNYNPNSEKVKKHYNVIKEWDKNLISDVFEIEKEKSREIYVAVDELVHLGILKLKVASGGGFSMAGGATYDFSKLGYEFIKYLDDVKHER